MHNQVTLQAMVARSVAGRRFVVVSNREPFIHVRQNGKIACLRPASGLTTALDPILQSTQGLWVAHGSGNADREMVDERSRVPVPPDLPKYLLKRVWLSKRQEEQYYYGFANQALWPLCHVVYQLPVFEEAHWQAYEKVNQLFADAIAEEVGADPAFVFIQDYHFALLSGFIRKRCPNVVTAQFWHIPWPNLEVFRICPWKEEILEGLLGNDILGFHLRYHCLNFMEAVERLLEARVDNERLLVSYQGVDTKVRAFPISVDFDAIQEAAQKPEVEAEMAALRERFGLTTGFLAAGLDRLDYTKGIPHRFRAIDRLLESSPRFQGRLTFLQAGVPTRADIPQYQAAEQEMIRLAGEINRKYERDRWRPIVFVQEHLSPSALYALYRMADVFIVSSLHDGMNLVAKEFVSARVDEGGVLVLSRFTGAAREMDEALLINPYAVDQFAETIEMALEMPSDEVQRRMRRLRQTVARRNVYRWANDILEKLADFEEAATCATSLG